MQRFKLCGDVKVVMLLIRAITYFHKTVQGFLTAIKNFTPEQRERYCKLLIAEYQQFQEIAVGIDG
jgi:hypothetical protein